MPVIPMSAVEPHLLPGLIHRTLAGPRDGLATMEVWWQSLEPGAATPLHRHDCEEVVIIVRGSGTCRIGDRIFGLQPDRTIVLPPNVVHQISNDSDAPMVLFAVLGMAPVRVETADGEPIPLPWSEAEGDRPRRSSVLALADSF